MRVCFPLLFSPERSLPSVDCRGVLLGRAGSRLVSCHGYVQMCVCVCVWCVRGDISGMSRVGCDRLTFGSKEGRKYGRKEGKKEGRKEGKPYSPAPNSTE